MAQPWVRRLERLEDFRTELRDRFGPPPEAVEWLLRLAQLRLEVQTLGVVMNNQQQTSLVAHFDEFGIVQICRQRSYLESGTPSALPNGITEIPCPEIVSMLTLFGIESSMTARRCRWHTSCPD